MGDLMVIEYSAYSYIGKTRKENQDSVFISHNNMVCDRKDIVDISDIYEADQPLIVAVFDGMGGEQEGGKASYIAAWATSEVFKMRPDASLKYVCAIVNKSICKYMEDNGIKSMGTTAAIVKTSEGKLVACNIGDSSIFKISNNRIKELSLKHIMVINHSGSNVLTQHLGIPENEMLIEPHSVAVKAKDGDLFLLCSDGLTDVLSEKDIKTIATETPVQSCSKKLVDAAVQKGSKDNISVIVLKILKEGII